MVSKAQLKKSPGMTAHEQWLRDSMVLLSDLRANVQDNAFPPLLLAIDKFLGNYPGAVALRGKTASLDGDK